MQQLDDLSNLDERLAQLQELRADFPDRNHPFEALAEAIVWATKVPADAASVESSARARRSMADVTEAERVRSAELDQAKAQALNLEDGLRLAPIGQLLAEGSPI